MRKRAFQCAMAVAMSVVMAVPQAGVNVQAASGQVRASAVLKAEEKTGPQITKLDTHTSWMDGSVDEILFPEIEHYSDYENAITGVSVNGIDYVKDWNDDDSTLVFEFTYTGGMGVYLGAFKEGSNVIEIKAAGYQTKTIVVSREGDTYTFVSQSDGGSAVDPVPSLPATSPEVTQSPEASDAPEVTASARPELQDPTEDGEYTVTFQSYKENSSEESMLGGFFANRAKLTVKDGTMKLSMLNTLYTSAMLDFTISSDGSFPDSERAGYGEQDSDGSYASIEYTIPVSTLSGSHKAAALVTMMQGSEEDKGNYDKYTKADFVFTSIAKGWDGYVTTGKQALVDALVARGYDTNDDGDISEDEIAAISEDLDLNNCGLTDISLLKGLTDKVTSIDLSENNLTEIPDGLFDNMTNLEAVYLNTNYLVSLPKDLFKNNKNLEWINLRSNKLSYVDKDTFAELPALKYLELDNNDIITVEDGALRGDTAMEQFAISGNILSSLPEDLFDSCENVDFINIAGNQFTRLPKCINRAKKLRKLIAYNNALTDISDIDYSQMSELVEVDFMKNYIEEIPDKAFANNKKMLAVDLHDNQLTNISGDIFADTFDNGRDDGKLQKLDVTMNNIKVVDPALMKKCDMSINKFYPQKTALSMTLSKGENGVLQLDQELSMLDLVLWYDSTASDEKRELETVEDYKDMLEQNGWDDKAISEVMAEKYEWDIITELQKKNADGTWETISEETESDKAENLSESFTVDKPGIYRVVKAVNTTLNGMKQYRFTAYSNVCDTQETPATDAPAPSDVPVPTPVQTPDAAQTTAPAASQTPGVAQTQTPAPAQPTANAGKTTVTVNKVSGLKVKKNVLSWKKVSGAEGYQVYRANGKKGAFKLLKSLKKNKYTDKKAKAGKTYRYKVRAYKTANGKKVYGKYSAVKKVTIKK